MVDRDLKRDAERRFTGFALAGMLIYPFIILLASVLGFDQAASLITDIASVYVIAASGVVAAFMGFNAYSAKADSLKSIHTDGGRTMIGQILGPVAGLASSWLDAKTTKQAAEAKLKLTEAEAKAKILLSEKTSVADWERIMAENSKSSWKDEFFVIVLSIPLILAFIPGAEGLVDRGFEQLHKAPDWYFYSLGIAISASFGVKGYKQFTRRK